MSQNMYGKEKTCESRFYWNLKLFTKVFTVGQMLSHTLDGLNFCATLLKMNALLQKISENFRNGKIFWRQNVFVGINYSLVNIFVTWQKIESLFTDKVFTDKGQSSRLLSHEHHGEDKCFSLSCKTLPIAKKTTCRNNAKPEKQGAWIAKNNLHRASTEKLKALFWVVLRRVFRIQLNVDVETFLQNQLMAFVRYSCNNIP